MVTQEEVRTRVLNDTARMYANQEPISGPITMEEAVARALKYNLDYRLKKMESALALGQSEYANYDMLPKLMVEAGYRSRSNDSGGRSIGIVDRLESLRPSTSEERNHHLASAEFSWNLLDFGVSYYRAKQQADQFLIFEERRRKVIHNLLQDVRASHWRALGAQRMEAEVRGVLERASSALERSREAEAQKIIAPALALNYQRALLDAITLLNQRRQDLAFAKSELAALMNVPPGVDFRLADAAEAKLPAAPTEVRKLEELALLQRPELREEDFKKRISADEARRQLVAMLPGISIDAGVHHDSNRFLHNNSWSQGGISIFANLMRLVALPSMKRTQAAQIKADEARRLALSMAIITQLRVAVDRYHLALEDFKLADQSAQVDDRLAKNMRASVTAKLESELEAIRTQTRATLGAYQRVGAYANAQIAFGRLYSTLGFDPIADSFETEDLAKLVIRVRQHLDETERGVLPLKSNLFGQSPALSPHLAGVSDPAMQTRMKEQIKALLGRNAFVVEESGNGLPLRYSLTRNAKGGLETAMWRIELANAQGETLGATQYATTLPLDAGSSVHESALLAAATQAVPKLRTWLGAVTTSAHPGEAPVAAGSSAAPALARALPPGNEVTPLSGFRPVALAPSSAPGRSGKLLPFALAQSDSVAPNRAKALSIRFEKNAARLGSRGRSDLAQVLAHTHQAVAARIRVRPFYADRRASVRLAQKRANIIRTALKAAGIPSSNIVIEMQGAANALTAEVELHPSERQILSQGPVLN